jgi:hypothetical protein
VGFFFADLFDQCSTLLIEFDLLLIDLGTLLCNLGLIKLLLEQTNTLLLWRWWFGDFSDGHNYNLVGVDVTAATPY